MPRWPLLRAYYALRISLQERAIERQEAPDYDDLGHVLARLGKLQKRNHYAKFIRPLQRNRTGP